MTPISIYVHIPFCNGKCPYCDFYSIKANEDIFNEYTTVLNYKIEEYSKKYTYPVKTIYFGGGTPSLIGTNKLIAILNQIKNNFNVINSAEITLECNPNTIDLIDFKELKENGFNRLSIGMQSAIDIELSSLGRKHNSEDVKNMVLKAQDAGFNNISLDLMIGIPNQTINSLIKSIEFCNKLKIQHISSYILKIEENTPFYKQKNTLNIANDDEVSDMYLELVNTLKTYGYNQYEISNFCKNGFESKHNLTYWRDEEYIGLGPSAHSFINGKRFFIERSFVNFYKDNITFEDNGGTEKEFIMLALRLNEGLIYENFEKKFSKKFNKEITKAIEKYEKHGYINITEKGFSLTPTGFLLSNTIIGDILDIYQQKM